MTVFWIVVALAVALVLALLFRPFWLKATSANVSRRQLNAAIYREQMSRLERDRAENMIAESDYTQARSELQRRVIEDTSEADDAASVRTPKKTMWAVGLVIPVVAIALYAMLGSPATLNPNGPQHAVTAQDVNRMVEGLAKRLENEPNNLEGWTMLARSYKMLGRNVEAEKAFERAGAFMDNDAQLLSIYAELAAGNANGDFSGKPSELIEKALRVDPKNAMAQWLAGAAAFRSKQFDAAIRIWERLSPQVEPDSEDARMLQDSLAAAYAALGKTAPVASAVNRAAPNAKIDPAMSVSGVVSLDGTLNDKVGPNDTVLVIARVPGTRMPVAVLRASVSTLPLKFSLDDSLSMSPQARISGASEVEVEARISKSGMAQAEAGDLMSAVQTVKVGAKGITLAVSKVRP
jgi:cytochrome c-type biogenesis protein CcmH